MYQLSNDFFSRAALSNNQDRQVHVRQQFGLQSNLIHLRASKQKEMVAPYLLQRPRFSRLSLFERVHMPFQYV